MRDTTRIPIAWAPRTKRDFPDIPYYGKDTWKKFFQENLEKNLTEEHKELLKILLDKQILKVQKTTNSETVYRVTKNYYSRYVRVFVSPPMAKVKGPPRHMLAHYYSIQAALNLPANSKELDRLYLLSFPFIIREEFAEAIEKKGKDSYFNKV